MKNGQYGRGDASNLYNYIRTVYEDIELFSKIANVTREEVDGLHTLSQEVINRPLNVRGYHDGDEAREPLQRNMKTEEIIFMCFNY